MAKAALKVSLVIKRERRVTRATKRVRRSEG